MNILTPIDQEWYSAHVKILFGVDSPFYTQGYQTATDDGNGKTIFRLSGLVPYPYYEQSYQFWVPDGPYAGFHSVISYDSINFDIYTDTDFIGPDPTLPQLVRTFYQVVPFAYRVYYGYPTQTNFVDLVVYHKMDATAYLDISSVLKNTFVIQPPVPGFDDSMYTYFRIDIIAIDAFADFLALYSLPITLFTGWNYLSQIYYAINGASPHARLQSRIANNEFICQVEPIYGGACCNVLTKVITDRAYNYIVCPEGEQGIGVMIIEENLIVG
jgi:hypothetical protein